MSTPQTRAAGRPRSVEKNAAILQAALQLLATEGYTRMSLSQVADAAQVSKSTIHLRWKTKADLVTAALANLRMAEAPPAGGAPGPIWWPSSTTSPPLCSGYAAWP